VRRSIRHRDFSVVLASLVFIPHQHRHGRAQRDAVEPDPAQNLARVLFVSRGRDSALSRASPVELELQLLARDSQSRRHPVHDAPDAAAVRLAERGDAEYPSERAPRARDRSSASPRVAALGTPRRARPPVRRSRRPRRRSRRARARRRRRARVEHRARRVRGVRARSRPSRARVRSTRSRRAMRVSFDWIKRAAAHARARVARPSARERCARRARRRPRAVERRATRARDANATRRHRARA